MHNACIEEKLPYEYYDIYVCNDSIVPLILICTVTWLTSAGMEAISTWYCYGESSERLLSLPVMSMAEWVPLLAVTAVKTSNRTELRLNHLTAQRTANAHASLVSYHDPSSTETTETGTALTQKSRPVTMATTLQFPLMQESVHQEMTQVASYPLIHPQRKAQTLFLTWELLNSISTYKVLPPCLQCVTVSCWNIKWIHLAVNLQTR